jgi:hypothetical protein
MPDTKKKDALAPTDKRTKHGLYSWVSNKRLPKGQAFQFIRRELTQLGEELKEAHGGDAITPEARILVDSIVEGLGVQKILGLYVRKYGVIDGQAARRGRLELSPILSKNWIGYANVVRRGILALKELEKDRQRDHGGPTLEAIRAEYEVQAEAVAGQDASGSAQTGRSDGSEGQGQADRIAGEDE